MSKFNLKDVFDECKKYNFYCDLDESYVNTNKSDISDNIPPNDLQTNPKYSSNLAYIYSKITSKEVMESIDEEGSCIVKYGIATIPKIFTKIETFHRLIFTIFKKFSYEIKFNDIKNKNNNKNIKLFEFELVIDENDLTKEFLKDWYIMTENIEDDNSEYEDHEDHENEYLERENDDLIKKQIVSEDDSDSESNLSSETESYDEENGNQKVDSEDENKEIEDIIMKQIISEDDSDSDTRSDSSCSSSESDESEDEEQEEENKENKENKEIEDIIANQIVSEDDTVDSDTDDSSSSESDCEKENNIINNIDDDNETESESESESECESESDEVKSLTDVDEDDIPNPVF
jgi:hypothetical protein